MQLTRFATKCNTSQVKNHLILFIDVRYIFFVCYNLIRVETCEEFAAQIINLGHFVPSLCSPFQCKNHLTNMTLGCAGLFYDTLLVYKATLLIFLTWGPYYHVFTWKFKLAWMKPTLHHLFCFLDLVKICNMKAVAIRVVELCSKFKTNGIENYIINSIYTMNLWILSLVFWLIFESIVLATEKLLVCSNSRALLFGLVWRMDLM